MVDSFLCLPVGVDSIGDSFLLGVVAASALELAVNLGLVLSLMEFRETPMVSVCGSMCLVSESLLCCLTSTPTSGVMLSFGIPGVMLSFGRPCACVS